MNNDALAFRPFDSLLAWPALACWKFRRGDMTKRINYLLDETSIIIDIGGYKGEWAEQILERYNSLIYIFEPMPEFYALLTEKFDSNLKVKVYPFGLGGKNEEISMAHLDNSSSIFKQSDTMSKISLRKASEVIRDLGLEKIDLMKINIEGGEYDLLDDCIASGLQSRIMNLQIQFHRFVPRYWERKKKITRALQKTHRLTYNYPYIWENWQRK